MTMPVTILALINPNNIVMSRQYCYSNSILQYLYNINVMFQYRYDIALSIQHCNVNINKQYFKVTMMF